MKCPTGKVQFRDEANALFYLEKLKKTSCREVIPKRTYLCNHCLSWHLTSQEDNFKNVDKRVENEFELFPKKKIENYKRTISKLQTRRRNLRKSFTDLQNKYNKIKNDSYCYSKLVNENFTLKSKVEMLEGQVNHLRTFMTDVLNCK